MENKARAKKGKKAVDIDLATLSPDTVEPKECDQVKESNITESKITESKVAISFQEIFTKNLDDDFKNKLLTKYENDILNTEMLEFISYRTEKNI